MHSLPGIVHASTRQDLTTVVDRNPVLYYATVLGAIIANDIGRFLFVVVFSFRFIQV
jgi:hypothetical protein